MAFIGKRVLVTGGANGLGLEIVRKFLGCNATSVVVLDKDVEQLAKVKSEFPSVITVTADLSNWDETRKALETVGPIDHLVNNAGVNRRESFMNVSSQNIDFIFGINFKAIVNVSQVIAKGMIDRGTGGTIVNISSLFGKMALQDISVYCASKSAVIMMTQCMALELGSSNIRVNAVCPQYMITPLTKDYIEKNPEKFDAIIDRQSHKRFLTPQETADSVIFLSSPQSSMITGQALNVDGGYSGH